MRRISLPSPHNRELTSALHTMRAAKFLCHSLPTRRFRCKPNALASLSSPSTASPPSVSPPPVASTSTVVSPSPSSLATSRGRTPVLVDDDDDFDGDFVVLFFVLGVLAVASTGGDGAVLRGHVERESVAIVASIVGCQRRLVAVVSPSWSIRWRCVVVVPVVDHGG